MLSCSFFSVRPADDQAMTLPRILIPAYDFKPLLGGVANYVHELAVQFSRRARVHVVSRKLPGMEEFDRDLPYDITRIRVPTAPCSPPRFSPVPCAR